jgi:hypothetical protein
MTRTQRMAAGKFMMFVAFLFIFTALMLTDRRLGTGMGLLILGLAFYGMGGGPSRVPLRELPAVCRALLALGFAYLGLAAVWAVVAKQSWITLLSQGFAVAGSVLAILGAWAYHRAAREAEGERPV